jgi:hypothetical protein
MIGKRETEPGFSALTSFIFVVTLDALNQAAEQRIEAGFSALTSFIFVVTGTPTAVAYALALHWVSVLSRALSSL